MNDRPAGPGDQGTDPVVSAALQTLVAPDHGPAFWDGLDARLGNGPATAPTAAVSPAEPAAPPPLADVIPLPNRPSPAGRSRSRWWIPVAAALAVVLGIATLARSSSTDVETTPAATGLPVETTVAPTTSAPAPTTAAPTTAAPRPSVAPATTARPTTTTTARPAALTLSPAGLGPLKLGMTTAQAEATGVVGPFQDPLETGGACGHAEPAGSYRAGDFSALFLNGRLARIYVEKGSRLRTPQGVGVGSPASKLGAVPGTRTESPHPYGGGTNVDIMSGSVGYQFTVDRGVVQVWSVGTTEGLSLPEGCA